MVALAQFMFTSLMLAQFMFAQFMFTSLVLELSNLVLATLLLEEALLLVKPCLDLAPVEVCGLSVEEGIGVELGGRRQAHEVRSCLARPSEGLWVIDIVDRSQGERCTDHPDLLETHPHEPAGGLIDWVQISAGIVIGPRCLDRSTRGCERCNDNPLAVIPSPGIPRDGRTDHSLVPQHPGDGVGECDADTCHGAAGSPHFDRLGELSHVGALGE